MQKFMLILLDQTLIPMRFELFSKNL